MAIPGFAQGQTSDQTREPVIHIAQAANALELEFWNSVKNSTDAGDFEAYLEAFPDGIFAPLAKIRVELYSESPATTAAPSGPDIEEIESLYDVLATSNLRQEPTAKSKRVGQLRAGTQVLVTGKVVGRNWYRVEAADGSSAYIYGDLVAKVKLRGEQEVAQQAASDDAARKAEEQAAAKKAVEEAARQAAAAEAARLAAEKKAAEEAKRLAAEKKAAEEAKRLAAEKKAAEEAAKRLAAAEKSASAARRRAEAAQTALAELQKQQAAEAQNRATAQKAAEEAERRAAAKAAADAAKRRAAAEAAVEEAERLVTTARETEADLRRAGTRKAAEEVERLAAARKALADAQRRVEALKSQLATLQENQASATKERTVTQEAAREALRQAQAEKTDAETARQAELDQANAAAAQLAAEHKAAAESRKQAEEERRVEAANRLAAAQKAAEEAVREAKAREAEVEKLQGQQAPKPDEAKKATEDLLDQAAARQAAPAAERPAATQNSGSESLRRPSAVQVAETEKTRQLAGGIARPALKRPAPLAEGFKDCRDCPEMIELAPGSFAMGSAFDASEQPVHTVRIDYRFAIGKHEITHGNWKACVDDGGCASLPGLRDNARKPARNISWDDTQQYLTWLRQKTERPYRLPTESEWEYAARANNKASFWWGDQPKAEHANCKGCGGAYDRKSPAEVGLFPPNPFGLHDMNGSVWEWVADCWQGSYDGHPTDGSSWQEEDCQTRVLRGGSWRNDISYARSASRFYYDADVRYSVNGFRVALTLQ